MTRRLPVLLDRLYKIILHTLPAEFQAEFGEEMVELFGERLAGSNQLVVASSQGISRHDLPTGEMRNFWTLAGTGFAPFLRPAADGSAVAAVRDQGGIYWLPLR